MNKKGIHISLIISLVIIVLFIVLIIIYFKQPPKVEKQQLEGGSVILTYVDDSSNLVLEEVVPKSDEDGISNIAADQYFDFTVTTDIVDANELDYELGVICNKETTINCELIKVYLEEMIDGSYVKVSDPALFKPIVKKIELGTKSGSMVIYKGKDKKSTYHNYRLRAWINPDPSIDASVTYKIVLNVDVYGKAK